MRQVAAGLVALGLSASARAGSSAAVMDFLPVIDDLVKEGRKAREATGR